MHGEYSAFIVIALGACILPLQQKSLRPSKRIRTQNAKVGIGTAFEWVYSNVFAGV